MNLKEKIKERLDDKCYKKIYADVNAITKYKWIKRG
jgi:hypothetical protein